MKIEMRGIAALAVMALLSACGGGGSDGVSPASNSHGARALASLEPAGAHCPAGGARIDAGIDLDGNGMLDASEIVSTQYVCDGAAGATGSAGANGLTGLAGAPGATGPSGLTALVQMSPEAAGAHCASGGTQVAAGTDANANGTLDTAEATSIAYVCNAAAGAAGANGTNGTNGGTGATGANGANGANGADGRDVLMSIAAAGASVACPAGASRIQSGLDTNRNATLDLSEVTATTLICNGSNGAAGSNGIGSLIAVVAEPAGVLHCAAGGSRITSGPDGNGNGVLDIAEVASTAYVCNGVAGTNGTNGSNGATGAAGSNGTNGANGAAGSNGANGANGFTTLTASVAEVAGIHCAAGGLKITSGADTSRDGFLDDPAEVTATSYVCNGFGAWVEVTAASMTAQPNTGYVASQPTQVTITLPASPNVGDVVRVSGASAGGWRIAQNPSQSIVTANLDVATVAKEWTDHGFNDNYRSVASSADGNRLIGAAYQGELLTSADAGLTWFFTGQLRGWTGVASSADGRRLVAVGFNESIWISDDYGASWTDQGHGAQWQAVASSADGRVLAAVGNGQVHVSQDYGVSWTAQGPPRYWMTIALSADGSRMVAAENGGMVYVSSDVGVTWSPRAIPALWRSVASSTDGRRLVAVAEYVPIYTSDDFGVTWTGVASSADGGRIVAVAGYDQNAMISSPEFIYSSSDQGLSWTPRGAADSWMAVASSADGSRLTAVANFGFQGISTSAPTRMTATTPGINGGIVGRQYQAIELQYIGNDQFMVLDAIGTGFDVQ